MAEGIFRDWLINKGISDIIVSSAGTGAFPGDIADENAAALCLINGTNISYHRSRRISSYLLDEADIIYCMDESHFGTILQYAPPEKIAVFTPGIPDPYRRGFPAFAYCFSEIKHSCDFIYDRCRTAIARMNENDIINIATLEAESFSNPWTENTLRQELSNPTSRFYTAYYNGSFAGYTGANIIEDWAYINNIAVCPKMRGHGIASSLLTVLKGEAIKNKCSFLTLEVRESNLNAISLYKRLGFVSQGIRPGYYELPRENAVIMTLNL